MGTECLRLYAFYIVQHKHVKKAEQRSAVSIAHTGKEVGI